jgi:hypothetical protein
MSSKWISIYIRGHLVSFIEFSQNYGTIKQILKRNLFLNNIIDLLAHYLF